MTQLRWKGELGDGEVHMTARDYLNHKVDEKHEKYRMMLRKIANNPILSEETKNAIHYAIFQMDDADFLRKRCSELKETIENMKARK